MSSLLSNRPLLPNIQGQSSWIHPLSTMSTQLHLPLNINFHSPPLPTAAVQSHSTPKIPSMCHLLVSTTDQVHPMLNANYYSFVNVDCSSVSSI